MPMAPAKDLSRSDNRRVLTPQQLKAYEPVEPMPAFPTPAAAKEFAHGIFAAADNVKRSGMVVCMRLAEFQDRGGYKVLSDETGPLPLAYFATPMCCSTGRIYQLSAAGRVARSIQPEIPEKVFRGLSEMHFRPLLALPTEARTPVMLGVLTDPSLTRVRPADIRQAVYDHLGLENAVEIQLHLAAKTKAHADKLDVPDDWKPVMAIGDVVNQLINEFCEQINYLGTVKGGELLAKIAKPASDFFGVLEAAVPYAMCSSCNGDKCDLCDGRGWMTKAEHEAES